MTVKQTLIEQDMKYKPVTPLKTAGTGRLTAEQLAKQVELFLADVGSMFPDEGLFGDDQHAFLSLVKLRKMLKKIATPPTAR